VILHPRRQRHRMQRRRPYRLELLATPTKPAPLLKYRLAVPSAAASTVTVPLSTCQSISTICTAPRATSGSCISSACRRICE
jgi:hypothetical protein